MNKERRTKIDMADNNTRYKNSESYKIRRIALKTSQTCAKVTCPIPSLRLASSTFFAKSGVIPQLKLFNTVCSVFILASISSMTALSTGCRQSCPPNCSGNMYAQFGVTPEGSILFFCFLIFLGSACGH